MHYATLRPESAGTGADPADGPAAEAAATPAPEDGTRQETVR
jgi:hypothetical protein